MCLGIFQSGKKAGLDSWQGVRPLSLFLGLPYAHGAVPVSRLRPGVLVAHGGPGLLSCRGKVRFHGERGGTLVIVCHCSL